ncbi:PAS domain S-box protein [candidate division WOR-3 bacterium]|nr:PAS domain S-box protein [candidate division WOR-3 bacterium]
MLQSQTSSANSDKRRKRPPVWLQILIIAITLIAVAVVVFLGSRTYLETRKMAIAQFNQQQLILARSAANGINAYFQELAGDISSLVYLPDIQQIKPECLKYMRYAYLNFPSRTSIRLLDRNGILRFIYPFDDWRGELIGKDYSKEDFFQEAKETGRIGVFGMVINEQGEARLRIAFPIYLIYKKETIVDHIEPGSGRFQGVLVGSFDPYIIAKEFTSTIVSGRTGYAWILNEDSIFLAHHEEEFTGRNAFEVRKESNPEISYEVVEHIQREMMAGEEGVGHYISGCHRGEKGKIENIIAYTPIHFDKHIWGVAVCAPVSEVEDIIHKSQRSERYTLAFVILALITGGLSLLIISYRWSHSLEMEVARRTWELKETSDYLNNLINYANAPIIVWDPGFRITRFNHAFEHLTGYTVEEVIDKELSILFPEVSRDESLRKIERTLSGEYWESVEISILRKDGEIRVALWNSANIYGDSKTVIATIAQGMDITERRQAEEELKKSFERLKTITDSIVHAIALAVEMKDPYTAGHQRRVAKLACAIAREMGLPEKRIEGIRIAAILHDVGKIHVPEEILNKQGKLTATEDERIKTHPRVGSDILKTIDFDWPIAEIVLQHHERINKSGYPQHLEGQNIILEGKIVAVADVVEAMCSARPYRPAHSIEDTLQEISQNKGILYDTEVVDACMKLFTEKGFTFD